MEIRRRYEDRLKNPSKEDRESLPGELVADLTALAGKLNEEAANRLIGLVEGVLNDIDSASELRESIRSVTAGHIEEQLGSVSIGSYALNRYDRLSILSSFSSGHSLATIITGGGLGLTAGIIAPPIGIAIGLGLGGLYAFQAFKGKGRALFQSEFRSWMSEQCNQTQVTVTTTFSREIIDLQEEIRDVVRQALVEPRAPDRRLPRGEQTAARDRGGHSSQGHTGARGSLERGACRSSDRSSTCSHPCSSVAGAPAPAAQPEPAAGPAAAG